MTDPGLAPAAFPACDAKEVALLAGVSIAYYTKLERGDAAGVSETVLESLARALFSSTRPSERTCSTSRVRSRRRLGRGGGRRSVCGRACSACSTP